MLGKIVFVAMILIMMGSTGSFGQQQGLPKVEFIGPSFKANGRCSPNGCPDYSERLVRHPIMPHLLIPERPTLADYFRRW